MTVSPSPRHNSGTRGSRGLCWLHSLAQHDRPQLESARENGQVLIGLTVVYVRPRPLEQLRRVFGCSTPAGGMLILEYRGQIGGTPIRVVVATREDIPMCPRGNPVAVSDDGHERLRVPISGRKSTRALA